MIYTRYGMANIKREVPGHFIKKTNEEMELDRKIEKDNSFRFQRNIRVKVKVSEYNSHAGRLSL